MTEHLLVLLVCLAVIAVLAILIYVASRGQIPALTAACEVRLALQQTLANTEKIDRSLQDPGVASSTTPTSAIQHP